MKLWFRDNFFSAGVTEILNEQEEHAGRLDLKSAFGSSVDIYGQDGALLYKGSFPFFSMKWEVKQAGDRRVGVLKGRFAWFSKRYSYDAGERGQFEITSPAFSKEYDLLDETGTVVARFEKVSGWFSSGAFLLNNECERLDDYELVAVVMGMYAMQKRNNAAGSNAAHSGAH